MTSPGGKLTIKLSRGPSESLLVDVPDLTSATVHDLKQLIAGTEPNIYPVAAQRLIFQGQILQDAKFLHEYNITAGCAVHLAVSSVAAQGSAPTTRSPLSRQSAPEQLRQCLQQMRQEQGFQTAVQTLQRICENILAHPHEEKYRKLRVSNAALKSRLFDRSKGLECVKVLGFQENVEEGFLVLVPDAEKWTALTQAKQILDASLVQAPTVASTGSTPSFNANPMGMTGSADMMNMASQARSMLENPMMAQMLQNHPMMQQMAQMNPMVAQAMQNPSMLAQQLQMLQQNPEMLQSMSQMMQNPQAANMLQQMMMQGSGGGNGGANGMGLHTAGSAGGASAPFGFPPSTAADSTAPNPFAPSSSPSTAFPAPGSSVPTSAIPAASVPTTASASTTPQAPAPAPAPAVPAGAPSTQEAENSGATVYDEEEIARAIARSLEEQ